MLSSYAKRRRRELRELGSLMSLAFNEPERIAEEFRDPPEINPNEDIESERWW